MSALVIAYAIVWAGVAAYVARMGACQRRLWERLQALVFSLPAATARKTPEEARLLAAVFTELLTPPPSDMFATAGEAWLEATQFIPAITPENVPLPLQSRTRTPRSATPLATP